MQHNLASEVYMSPEEHRLHRIREDFASDMRRTTWQQQQQSADSFERIQKQADRLRTSSAWSDREHATADAGSSILGRMTATGIIAALIGSWIYLLVF